MDTTLVNLRETLGSAELLSARTDLKGRESLPVSGVDCDSRVVAPGHLFVCKGAAFRPAYLASAVEAGAVAYLCDESHAEGLAAACPEVPVLVVRDEALRPAMALVSAAGWGHPDQAAERPLGVVGITGTKGKSTTAYMLRHIVDAGPDGTGETGSQASVLGSIDTYDGVESFESHNTTPEPPDLWRHLANARRSGHDPMVMEVSSHALKYDRVTGLRLAVACFLNIGRDHISPIEHPSWEDYFASKLRIFGLSDVAVVNLATEHVEEVLAAAAGCERLVTFAVAEDGDSAEAPQVAGQVADIWASDVTSGEGTVDFLAHTPEWEAPMHLGMPGLFNVDNALCAIACACLLDIGPEQIRAGLSRCRVPGRMELVTTPDPHVAAIVDYAHNKLSYQRFFSSVSKEFAGRRIIAVLGAPGDKAQERRVELPQEAAKWADALIYTEEDPAHERVEDINAEMLAATPVGCRAEGIVGRGEAIARAVEIAYESETPALVCLLAKGDETRQHEGDLFVPCDTDETLFLRAMEAHLQR